MRVANGCLDLPADDHTRYAQLQYRQLGYEDSLQSLRQQFIGFAVDAGVLRFGRFTTKAGRDSPYFFNAGLFHDGTTLGQLGQFYAQTLIDSGIEFDMLFGPAYKGITLAAATAVALAARGRNVSFAYNRKEVKAHGEGGTLVGANLAGRVVIIDDVISAGTSVHESVAMIRAAGATPCAVLIALDRMERSGPDDALSEHSAVQEVSTRFSMPVVSIANLDDLLTYMVRPGANAGAENGHAENQVAISAYRARYGVG